ncbi:MAG: M14 family metallopeptidase [Cyclobacteriaceae bacterium]|jgi:hypothetical protein|nr:M14 family metallopeptidase [Cyclobacteriaceae bacterium]
MKNLTTVLVLSLMSLLAGAQGQPLSYYLPTGTSYDPAIPTPAAVIGHEVGEWHVTHDRLVNYMYALDRASDRITITETGKTHEGRPLLLLTVTAPANHQNIEKLRAEHLKLTDPAQSASVDIANMPAVFYVGFSIHGNEASGVNAGLLTAYHLAAAQGKEMDEALANTIILLDPCYNPDGVQRFSGWVNSRKSRVVSADPNDNEHHEPWPGGRFNHYWFDLNRDWLVAQHPESQARATSFHQWKPNVLTDHHEMGTNATFFFQPGVPSRMHPLTPEKNLELTRKIGTYHAKALDQIGSLYYTQEGFDDFYYGKGSTFPDVQGAIGILFEQGSSRGHLQESINGPVTFAFTIRNQFVTSLSSLRAVVDMRAELLAYQRDFYKNSVTDAAKDPVKAYVIGSKDKAATHHFVEMVRRHQVEVYANQTASVNGKPVEVAYTIPLNQPQYRLLKGMFDKRTVFKDSLFYDISSWTLPLAFGLEYEEVKTLPVLGEKVSALPFPTGKKIGNGTYAYLIEPYGYYAPRAMYRLLHQGYKVKVATEPFVSEGRTFARGTLLIAKANQTKTQEELQQALHQITTEDGLDVYATATGLDYVGVSLGSGSFLPVRKPEIAMLVEGGVSATDVGELWHLLDVRYGIPVALMPLSVLNASSISRYNTLLMAEGSYYALPEATKEKLKAWVQAGGVIIGFEGAVSWLHTAGLAKFDVKGTGGDKEKKEPAKPKPYADIEETRGAQVTSGAIFEAQADLTHPLLYGYTSAKLPMFKPNNLFMEKAVGAFSNPLVYGANPLISGYISKPNYERMKNTALVGVSALGRGRVIGFTENLAFRGFWLGSNKMVMNAIFYGPLVSAEACR